MSLTADIQQQVFDLLSRASNLSFVSAEEESTGTPSPALAPGQRVTAEVLSKLPDNRVQVQIGSQRFNMQLPMAVRQGQSLELTFVSAEPRSTFAIARSIGAQPVSLSDASRLLGLLVGSEQVNDPQLRASLQSIGDMLRRTSGAGVLANLMDEAVTYGSTRNEPAKPALPVQPDVQQRDMAKPPPGQTSEQTRLAAFETNAARILENIARSSRVVLAEAVTQPVVPLPLLPGEDVDAAVLGTLPGGRAFVQVAGTELELKLPRKVPTGEILRLTFISSYPKPLFALTRSELGVSASTLSGAGRWLSVLEHSQGGLSDQQLQVLDRLNTVLKSLPADSPAFTAINEEAITYDPVKASRMAGATQAAVAAEAPPLFQGNGIILSDDMAKLLQALIKGNRLSLLEALDHQPTPLGLVAGQQLKAEVLASLGGGRFLVQVGEQSLEFSLPRTIRKGDLLNLFFISEENQPTFLMARFGRSGDSRVTDTSRWLSRFLGVASERMPAQETLGVLKSLLTGPPVDAERVGAELQRGLRESGLFYESHLSRWFKGDYPLDDLLAEPQGGLSNLKKASVAGPQPDPLPEEALPAGNRPLETMEVLFKKAGETRGHEGIADQRALPVVREQLEALQGGQLVFRGELFPGQQMEWKVGEREHHRGSSGKVERSWNTDLNLDLPHLGKVRASVRIDGKRVSIDIKADEAASADLLLGERSALIEQLEAAGLGPDSIEVSHGAP